MKITDSRTIPITSLSVNPAASAGNADAAHNTLLAPDWGMSQ